MNKVYIIGGLRTPIGLTNGQFSQVKPAELAAQVLTKTINQYQLSPSIIDEVLLGNAVGPGGNLARLSLLTANWPVTIPGTTIDFQCGGGLKAVNLAANLIKSGQHDLVIAGGVESTSLEPRRCYHQNDPRAEDNNEFWERASFSPDWLGDPDLGITAENTAELKNISRSAMDQWALTSHQRAAAAQEKGLLSDIKTSISTNQGLINTDEGIRPNISLEFLQRLQPVFKQGGTITAGNCCLTHDGAATLLLASEKAVNKFSLTPTAQFVGSKLAGVDPNLTPLAPISATKQLLAKTKLSPDDIAAVEINEAFAVKALAYIEELELSAEQVNQLGGALAYGHPYGASGAIILLHLLQALADKRDSYGVATLAAAGGLGIASLIKKM